MTIAVLAYAALSLVLGGIAATYEIWHFPSPKVSAVGIGLFVALFWPVLVVVLILDVRAAREK